MNTIIVTSEQAADVKTWRDHLLVYNVMTDEPVRPDLPGPTKPTLTLRTPVEPQPERVKAVKGYYWMCEGEAYGDDELHAAILAHWWTVTCGNEARIAYLGGSPLRECGQPVPGPVMLRSVDCDDECCWDLTIGPATLVSMPVVEQERYDFTHMNSPEPDIRERFVIAYTIREAVT